MEIRLAKTAGFCFGVARAVNTLESKDKNQSIKTLGPIIHNNFVVESLKNQGVGVALCLDDIEKNDILAIRTHGVPKSVIDEAVKREISFIDLTCPFVKRIHEIVSKYHAKGYTILIGTGSVITSTIVTTESMKFRFAHLIVSSCYEFPYINSSHRHNDYFLLCFSLIYTLRIFYRFH